MVDLDDDLQNISFVNGNRKMTRIFAKSCSSPILFMYFIGFEACVKWMVLYIISLIHCAP